MVAGLAVQVASLLLFIIICSELAWRWKSMYKQGRLSTKHERLYRGKTFRDFICGKLVHDRKVLHLLT